MGFRLIDHLEIADGATMRRISLYQGEIEAIPAEHAADILIASAFPDDYLPTPTSLIGALHRKGLSVGMLATNKAIDLRTTSAIWISHPIQGAASQMNIKRLACFEPRVIGSPPGVVGHLFRGLFPLLDDGLEPTVMMPVLATGDQRSDPGEMFARIVEAAAHWLARGLPIKELKIVERNPERAKVFGRLIATFKAKATNEAQPQTSQKQFDVFLSFSNEDRDAANHTKKVLTKNSDVQTIFDYRLSIDPGTSWQEEIDQAIASCHALVSILSPSYFASEECKEELMQARLRSKKKTMLHFPIYWRDLGRELDLWLQTLNYGDCRESNVKKLEQVISMVAVR